MLIIDFPCFFFFFSLRWLKYKNKICKSTECFSFLLFLQEKSKIFLDTGVTEGSFSPKHNVTSLFEGKKKKKKDKKYIIKKATWHTQGHGDVLALPVHLWGQAPRSLSPSSFSNLKHLLTWECPLLLSYRAPEGDVVHSQPLSLVSAPS